MLNILHTSDWHLGKTFRQFDEPAATRLAQERLNTVENIMRLAQRRNVDAVLCAGDLFDTHDPPEPWWRALLERFQNIRTWNKPVILLPGNHDPLMTGSVYETTHPFRRQLPDWVEVVDTDNYERAVGDRGVVYATPCRSKSGAPDAARRLPERQPGDDRIRIGLVHGQTWERSATPFPVSKHAAKQRGLDYLALGDTHSFEEVVPGEDAPVVYCGTPEPTRFGEDDPGHVVLVRFRRPGVRPRVERERVGRYVWRQQTVSRLDELRNLVEQDLKSTVLRLTIDITVSVTEDAELERLIGPLQGTDATGPLTGAFQCERHIRISTDDLSIDPDWPPTIREVAERLQSSPDPSSQRALVKLVRLVHELAEAG